MQHINWSSTRYKQASIKTVLETPGVYAIVRTRRISGLPLGMQILYAGQSNNLRRRLSEHLKTGETNPALVRLAINREKDLEFWWAPVQIESLNQVERELIGTFTPPANRILYKPLA